MGKRYYIHVGDRTSVGGKVLTGLANFTWHGNACSFEGDSIECPACKSPGTIRCIGTRISSIGPNGKQRALNGDLCICRCSQAPELVASQSTHWTEGEVGVDNILRSTAEASCSERTPSNSNKWIKFILTENGSCEGIECIAHFDDGSQLRGSFDAENLVIFHGVTGTKVERVEFPLSPETNEESISDILLRNLGEN
jgi:uncharacterized Zn-binding protein involved in type VI secretion